MVNGITNYKDLTNMSRTTRVNLIYSRGKGREDAICRDGKQRWKCKCSYCLKTHKRKFYAKIAKQEIITATKTGGS